MIFDRTYADALTVFGALFSKNDHAVCVLASRSAGWERGILGMQMIGKNNPKRRSASRCSFP